MELPPRAGRGKGPPAFHPTRERVGARPAGGPASPAAPWPRPPRSGCDAGSSREKTERAKHEYDNRNDPATKPTGP